MDAVTMHGNETAGAVAIDAGPATRKIAFRVSDVAPATNPLAETTASSALDGLLLPRLPWDEKRDDPLCIDACSSPLGRLVAGVDWHPVVAAVHRAFHDHRPLVLSPDIVWTLIAQGFAQHVHANAEALRSRFVSHAGQQAIEIRRDDLVMGSGGNAWTEVVDELTVGVRAHIESAAHDLLVPTFTTTGPNERTAAQVVLLDAMQSYFTYTVQTMCGIPQVVLEGTVGDWSSLAQRTEVLGEFELRWWTEALRPILAEFVAAAHGAARTEFWQSIYKHRSASGGPYVTGWISAFFPYVNNLRTNRATVMNPSFRRRGAASENAPYSADEVSSYSLTTASVPSGLATAPFTWRYLSETHEMEFLAGFVGVRQDGETLSLRPEIGWAVSEPARRAAIQAVRSAERRKTQAVAAQRTFDRAAAWKSKALCRQCGTWVYEYGDATPAHCGRKLSEVIARPQA